MHLHCACVCTPANMEAGLPVLTPRLLACLPPCRPAYPCPPASPCSEDLLPRGSPSLLLATQPLVMQRYKQQPSRPQAARSRQAVADLALLTHARFGLLEYPAGATHGSERGGGSCPCLPPCTRSADMAMKDVARRTGAGPRCRPPWCQLASPSAALPLPSACRQPLLGVGAACTC